jgi:plastocyanin
MNYAVQVQTLVVGKEVKSIQDRTICLASTLKDAKEICFALEVHYDYSCRIKERIGMKGERKYHYPRMEA